MTSDSRIDRRHAIKLGLMGLAATPWSGPVLAAGTNVSSDKHLSFFNTHTRESLDTLYCFNGDYQPAALSTIDYILRDHRANEIKPIDARLLDLLHQLHGELDCNGPFHVISGYRSPATNAMLQRRGGEHAGVASRSLHMDGKAIDIRVPGVPLQTLHHTAKNLRVGGVGFYPALDFVHVDVGRVRYW